MMLSVPFIAPGWDYGDTVYGLEPLTLPAPGSRWAFGDASDAVEGHRRHREHEEHRTAIKPAAEEDLEALFWFRWITGHHISFILWQFLANCLEGEDLDGTEPGVAAYVRGYSASLLYTGSCTRETYNAVIRPSMYRVHPGFSGTWAADYAAVRGLFRRRRIPSLGPDEQARVKREVELSHQVHMGLASRLVPSGRSLLQGAADSMIRKPQYCSALFDCYFITLRAPVPAQQVAAQLLRRCKAVVLDITANGLYPAVARYPEEFPEELRSAEVRNLEEHLIDIMMNVAGLATAQAESR
jgi:hypothetical protein